MSEWIYGDPMKILPYTLVTLVACGIVFAAPPVQHATFLQWSKKTIVKSPNERLQIEVHPILTDEENHSPVVVRRLVDQHVWRLITLSRAAQTAWSFDSKKILVIDQPTADNYRVLLLSSEGKRAEVDTDKMIRAAAVNLIGPGRAMEFYLPMFVSWDAKELVLAVGGTSSNGVNRPMTTYCLGVRVDSNSGKVLATFPETEPKRQFNSQCRLDP